MQFLNIFPGFVSIVSRELAVTLLQVVLTTEPPSVLPDQLRAVI